MAGDVILEVSNLRKEFEGRAAVEDLSFRLHRGEILGLLGVNGAGKTTAMNMILGLISPTSGSIRAFGMPMPGRRTAILRRANFCSAYAALPSNLLVHQNLTVFGLIYGVKDRRRRIDSLLELLEIGHLRDRVTGQLSSGESTRVNLCKALLNRPELLMLDEPTASLDPDIADKVRTTLRQVQREEGIGMLYTSHNMRDIEEICDRVIFIHHGKVLAEGTPADVVARSKHESLEEMFIELARATRRSE
ncbi:MAG: ABC transporter ATP-binding protein [Terrimicrobiaceae bacterium]|nr:ABC transporter ATP-binding protein [Terrimicrobiaceae bacterium]